MRTLLFLPGASGNRDFWGPVAERLTDLGACHILGWPGLGGVPALEGVTSVDDLVALVLKELGPDTHLIAQSMGTVVALRTALAVPGRVNSLTLVATAGGLDMKRLGATDWREGAHEWHPEHSPRYFFDACSDFSDLIRTIACPTLLIAGGKDPLSPVAVSEQLQRLLPSAQLESIPDGDHDLAHVHADFVATLIRRHLLSVGGGSEN